VGKREEGLRVVLDLREQLHHRVFYLPEPFRVVIDLSSRPPAADPRTADGKRVVRRVAIDPGHGGADGGAVGPTGLREKDVALDVAHRVAPLLAHELKIETLLTRDGDVYVPLEERTARANAFHADLFVSIHCNASENGDARGVETFVLDPFREAGRASARLVALENGLLRGKTPPDPAKLDAQMDAALASLSIGDNGARSRLFGELLQRSTMASMAKRYDGTRDHGVKTAAFYVLAGAEMPAVLFETSFISNPDDEARLATADYRQKLADSIVNAVRAYRDGK
jgi:N-acetylmuramoyl-L-alanine amidase